MEQSAEPEWGLRGNNICVSFLDILSAHIWECSMCIGSGERFKAVWMIAYSKEVQKQKVIWVLYTTFIQFQNHLKKCYERRMLGGYTRKRLIYWLFYSGHCI